MLHDSSGFVPVFNWIKENSLKRELLDKEDFDNIFVVDNIQEVTKMLKPHIEAFYVNKLKSKP